VSDVRGPGASPVHGASVAEELVPARVREFTGLVERLFADLIALPDDRLDDGLVDVLGSVSTFIGTDRGFVVRYDHDARTISMTHEWCAPGIPPAFEREQDRPFDDMPQEQARLLRHEINEIRDVAHLPEDWEADAEYLAEEGITAILEFPFLRDGRVAGLVGFDNLTGPATWIDQDLPVLRSVAALVEHAFERGGSVRTGGDVDRRLEVFERSPIAILVVDSQARIVAANDVASRLVGRDRDALHGVALEELLQRDDAAGFRAEWAELGSGALDSCSVEVRLHGGGPSRWCRLDVLADRPDGGELVGGTVHVWDLSDQRLVVDELERTEARFSSLVAALPEGIIQFVPGRPPEFVNQAAIDLRDRLVAAGVADVDGWPDLPEELVARLRESMLRAIDSSSQEVVEFPVSAPGGVIWLECTLIPQPQDGDDPIVLVVLRDTTSGHQHRAELEHQANHDHLTGLPNRVAFLSRLTAACGAVGDLHDSVGLLFVDLDDFKVVNDSLGHDAGDALLGVAARRLRERLGTSATVARFGGDEFTILATDVSESEVLGLAEEVREVLAEPAELDGRRFLLAASVGVVRTDRPADPADLLRWADAALYEAKAAGRDRTVVVDDALRARVADRTALGLELKVAAQTDQLVVHYQPEVDLLGGSIVGAEALVRWQHPVRGLLQPGAFIGLAEDNGAIDGIGREVLYQSCRDAAGWEARGRLADDFVLRVNVSVRQLELVDFPDLVRDVLERTGLSAARLTLEVTETTVMRDAELGLAAVDRLRDLGVRLAIDDFGTGYSSLQLLKRLPIDVVKIDRSFVADLPADPEDRAIVETIVRLTEVLGLGVTAEGVERREQLSTLLELGCRSAQGFLFSRPVPAEAFERLLDRSLVPVAD